MLTLQTYRINDIPQEPTSSHDTMASSLPLISSHGWQGMGLRPHGGSLRIKSPDHGTRSLRPDPVQSGQHQLSTPLEVMKHPVICAQASSSSVHSEKPHAPPVVTRLADPIHYRNKLIRSRGQTPNPTSTSPEEAEHSEMEGSGASEPLSVEAPEYGWWAFEKNAGFFLEPKGKQLCTKITGQKYPEITFELPGTFAESYDLGQSMDSSPESFAMNTRRELTTPFSAFVPSPWSSSATSQQTPSQMWSATSRASTFSEQSKRASPRLAGPLEYKSQNPCFNDSSWVAPASVSLFSHEFSPKEDASFPEMSLTSSPEELISTQITFGLWSSANPPIIQHDIFENACVDALIQSQYTAENTQYIVGPGETTSGRNSDSLNIQHYPMSTSVSSDFMSSACSAIVVGQSQLGDQPISGMSLILSEHDNPIVVEDNPAVTAMSNLSSFSLPGTRKSMAKPRSRAKRTQRARHNSRFDDATESSKHGILRCQIAGCKHQSTGLRKNLNGHLERHMKTHLAKKMPCPIPGCKRDFPLDRSDNLKAHCRRVHRNDWKPEGQSR